MQGNLVTSLQVSDSLQCPKRRILALLIFLFFARTVNIEKVGAVKSLGTGSALSPHESIVPQKPL